MKCLRFTHPLMRNNPFADSFASRRDVEPSVSIPIEVVDPQSRLSITLLDLRKIRSRPLIDFVGDLEHHAVAHKLSPDLLDVLIEVHLSGRSEVEYILNSVMEILADARTGLIYGIARKCVKNDVFCKNLAILVSEIVKNHLGSEKSESISEIRRLVEKTAFYIAYMDGKLLENMIPTKEYMISTKAKFIEFQKELLSVIEKRFHIELSEQTKSRNISVDHMISSIRKGYAESILSIYRFFEPPLIPHMYILLESRRPEIKYIGVWVTSPESFYSQSNAFWLFYRLQNVVLRRELSKTSEESIRNKVMGSIDEARNLLYEYFEDSEQKSVIGEALNMLEEYIRWLYWKDLTVYLRDIEPWVERLHGLYNKWGVHSNKELQEGLALMHDVVYLALRHIPLGRMSIDDLHIYVRTLYKNGRYLLHRMTQEYAYRWLNEQRDDLVRELDDAALKKFKEYLEKYYGVRERDFKKLIENFKMCLGLDE